MPQLQYSLWYDKEAVQAVETYTNLFPASEILARTVLPDTPSGDVDYLIFNLGNLQFSAMSAGDYFKLNESISIMVTLSSKEELDRIYATLSQDGKILMPLQAYDFNPYFVWLQDAYGLNWQLFLDEKQSQDHTFKLCFLFGMEQNGLAEPAMDFFIEKLGAKEVLRQPYPEFPGKPESAKLVYGQVNYLNQDFVFMDHGAGGDSLFSPAFSLSLLCQDQAEIDHYWDLLSKVAEAEACGWCQDDFGLSWQVVPAALERATLRASREDLKAMQAIYYPMKKFEIAPLSEFFKDATKV